MRSYEVPMRWGDLSGQSARGNGRLGGWWGYEVPPLYLSAQMYHVATLTDREYPPPPHNLSFFVSGRPDVRFGHEGGTS
jgi:hypothetical protein